MTGKTEQVNERSVAGLGHAFSSCRDGFNLMLFQHPSAARALGFVRGPRLSRSQLFIQLPYTCFRPETA